MVHFNHSRLVFLTILLFFFLPKATTAQIKRGIKLLSKKDTASAQIAFEKDLTNNNKVKAMTAQHYMYVIQEKRLQKTTPLGEQLELAIKIWTLQRQLEALPQKERKKLADYKVSPYSMGNIRQNIRTKTAKLYEKEWNILDYDKFLKDNPLLAKEFSPVLKKARVKLVKTALENADDYATLRSLGKNHRDILQNESINITSQFKAKLFQSFIYEHGIVSLGEFVADFPDHPMSKDCWIQDLISSYQKSGRQGGLDFLNNCPQSTVDIFVIADILYHQKTLTNLTEAQQKRLNGLTQHSQINNKINLLEARQVRDQILDYIKLEAPSRRSYELLQKSIQRLINLDSISMALELLDNTQELYPDVRPKGGCALFTFHVEKQMWFDTARAILKRPDEQSKRIAVENINTFANEFSPLISATGKTLYFSGSARGEDEEGDEIYVSNWVNNAWSNPVLVKELSGEGNQSPLSLSPDGKTMLLFSDGKLNMSRQNNGKWSNPLALNTINQSFEWVGKATMSSDSRVLILEASKNANPIEGDANSDLFISRLIDTGWTKPVPLSSNINTRFLERSPYLHTDDQTLYFASEGHPGLGGIDIFKTTRLDNTWQKWSKPYNIGRKFNTIYDDWGINFTIPAHGHIAYFSSAADQQYYHDIYTTGLPPAVQPKPTAVVKIPIKSPDSIYTLSAFNYQGELIKKVRVRADNNEIIVTFPKDSVASYKIESQNTFAKNVTMPFSTDNVTQIDTVRLQSVSETLRNNAPIPLPPIEFDLASANLRPEARIHLDSVARFLDKKPWIISIEGHTDDTGTKAENLKLSQDRADTVKAYLLKVVPNLIIETTGHGAEKPVRTGKDEQARQANRRVEIRIREKNNVKS